MHFLRSIGRTLKFWALTAACWAAVTGPDLLLAAAPKKAADSGMPDISGSGSWLSAYAVVILMIALGLLSVCHASRRRDRARGEGLAEVQSSVKPE